MLRRSAGVVFFEEGRGWRGGGGEGLRDGGVFGWVCDLEACFW